MAGKYFCDCARFCKGGKYVCKATFYKHAPLRLQPGTIIHVRPIIMNAPNGGDGEHVQDLENSAESMRLETQSESLDDTLGAETAPATPCPNEDDLMQGDGASSTASLRVNTGDSPSGTVYYDPPHYRWNTHSELPPFYRKFASLPSTHGLIHGFPPQNQSSSGLSLVDDCTLEKGNEIDEEHEPGLEGNKRIALQENGLDLPADQEDHLQGTLRAFGDLTNALGVRSPSGPDTRRLPSPAANDESLSHEKLTFINTTLENFEQGYYNLESHCQDGISNEDDGKENDAPLYAMDTALSPISDASTSPTISSPPATPKLPGPPKSNNPRIAWITNATHQALLDCGNRPYMTLYNEYHRLHAEYLHMHATFTRLHGEYGRMHQDCAHLQLAANFYMGEGVHVKNENARMYQEIMRLRGEVERLGGGP